MFRPVFGVAIEPWAKGVVVVALSIGLVFIVVVGGSLMVVILAKRLADRLNEVAAAVSDLERQVFELRETGIPAFASFLGTVGVATSSLVVSPVFGFLISLVLAGATFAFASLAKDQRCARYRRWLAAVAAMAPFIGTTVGVFASGRFASLSLTTQIALSVGLVIGVVGLTGVVQAAARAQISSAVPAAA
jgi:biopolymer transport protein ExbB/TolQ